MQGGLLMWHKVNKLIAAIRDCTLFMPVISANSVAPGRRAFKEEWYYGAEEAKRAGRNETFIVPVVIDDTSINDPALDECFRVPQAAFIPDGRADGDFVTRVAELYRRNQSGSR